MPRKRTPKYKVIDIGNTSETKKARYEKILKQIPKGKALVLTDSTFDQPSNKALVEVIDPRDIPPDPKSILRKAGFKHVTETDKTKPKRKKHK
jgi:hypothetical protein